jgi:hypothetical protein
MAFKMTPGIKGNPSMNRIKNLGGCGGPGQPPCPPRFQQEKTAALVADKSSTSRSKSIRKKAAVVAPAPVKLKINLPEGYKFRSKLEEVKFYDKFGDLSGFKSQEELDKAISAHLKGGGAAKPLDPKEPGQGLEKDVIAPIKGEAIEGGESEAAPIKK